jgi:hypothetical protein
MIITLLRGEKGLRFYSTPTRSNNALRVQVPAGSEVLPTRLNGRVVDMLFVPVRTEGPAGLLRR